MICQELNGFNQNTILQSIFFLIPQSKIHQYNPIIRTTTLIIIIFWITWFICFYIIEYLLYQLFYCIPILAGLVHIFLLCLIQANLNIIAKNWISVKFEWTRRELHSSTCCLDARISMYKISEYLGKSYENWFVLV